MTEPPIGWFTAISTYFGYLLLILFGHFRDWLDYFLKPKVRPPPGYAPFVADWEAFYTRRLYHRVHDCWNRPICSFPGAYIDVMERKPLKYGEPIPLTGSVRRCLNLGSYNYLGFGDNNSPTKPHVLAALEQYGVNTCSSRAAYGTTALHRELESVVARFVRKEDAMVFGMGFGTNSTGIPSLVGKGGLIISDACNHSSIVVGARSSGAQIRVFAHNDPADLEKVIRKAIIEGQPKSRRPWKKIVVVVEGIYSMEGEICPLREIVAVKKKYKCYLYVDEAHSIGALGQTGRGVCEHSGVNPDDVDLLMGTFTKSFGAVGGYIAASKDVVRYLRSHSAGSAHSPSISPPVCAQVISAMKIIMGEDGTDIGKTKLNSLRENSNFFRQAMIDMGCHVMGDWDSPIVPVMIYNPAKIACVSRETLKRNLAIVVVGYPASPLLFSRIRFCISAAHTLDDLRGALKSILEIVDYVGFRYGQQPPPLPKSKHFTPPPKFSLTA